MFYDSNISIHCCFPSSVNSTVHFYFPFSRSVKSNKIHPRLSQQAPNQSNPAQGAFNSGRIHPAQEALIFFQQTPTQKSYLANRHNALLYIHYFAFLGSHGRGQSYIQSQWMGDMHCSRTFFPTTTLHYRISNSLTSQIDRRRNLRRSFRLCRNCCPQPLPRPNQHPVLRTHIRLWPRSRSWPRQGPAPAQSRLNAVGPAIRLGRRRVRRPFRRRLRLLGSHPVHCL